jgi:hypothetical protein
MGAGWGAYEVCVCQRHIKGEEPLSPFAQQTYLKLTFNEVRERVRDREYFIYLVFRETKQAFTRDRYHGTRHPSLICTRFNRNGSTAEARIPAVIPSSLERERRYKT